MRRSSRRTHRRCFSAIQLACTRAQNEEVAIKIVDLEQSTVPLDVLRKEIMTLGMSNHPNVVAFYTSFLVEDKVRRRPRIKRAPHDGGDVCAHSCGS